MPAPESIHPWQWPGRPWSKLHLDFADPFMGHMFLVLGNAHSKWLESCIMSNITASVTAGTLRSIFTTHGLPDTIMTDNGPTFTSKVFKEFIEKNGICHVCAVPYHPATNGFCICISSSCHKELYRTNMQQTDLTRPGCQESFTTRQIQCLFWWTCLMAGRFAGIRITCMFAMVRGTTTHKCGT